MTASANELLDILRTTPRGMAFLINIEHSFKHGLEEDSFLEMVTAFGRQLSVAAPLPTPEHLIEQLGWRCVGSELWRQCDEPVLHFFSPSDGTILSRVTTYGRFCNTILGRTTDALPLPDIPNPLPIDTDHPAELLASDVPRVRAYIDDNRWRPKCAPEINFDGKINWMTPRNELARKIDHDGRNPGDRCRDVVGLSHFGPGEHLIRIDIDLQRWPAGATVFRRRPNGACNGGKRFLMPYDDPIGCNWGRTVDLSVLAQRLPASLNGVPELVMGPILVPKEAVSTSYIGSITDPPEQDDAYFLSRISHHQPYGQP